MFMSRQFVYTEKFTAFFFFFFKQIVNHKDLTVPGYISSTDFKEELSALNQPQEAIVPRLIPAFSVPRWSRSSMVEFFSLIKEGIKFDPLEFTTPLWWDILTPPVMILQQNTGLTFHVPLLCLCRYQGPTNGDHFGERRPQTCHIVTISLLVLCVQCSCLHLA